MKSKSKIKLTSSIDDFEKALYDAINSDISKKFGADFDIRKDTSINALINHFFTPKFIKKETNNKFENIEDFLSYIGINNSQDLEECTDEKINKHVEAFTSSKTWQELFDKAFKQNL